MLDDALEYSYIPKKSTRMRRVASSDSTMEEGRVRYGDNISPIEQKYTDEDTHSDWLSCCILLFLYTLQGIPMGLSGSIPLLLKERQVSLQGNVLLYWRFFCV